MSEEVSNKDVALIKSLVGRWKGERKTWFVPGTPSEDSMIEGEFTCVFAGSDFLSHKYSSTIQGKPHFGEETIALDKSHSTFQTAWIDTFHMSPKILFSVGATLENKETNGFVVKGEYDACGLESGKIVKWGWRTEYALIDTDHLTITAFNITPQGQEGKAIETKYERQL